MRNFDQIIFIGAQISRFRSVSLLGAIVGIVSFQKSRADSIVKGMLQHARATSGEKQPTDINALVDEYLRLAYHGLRGKEKEFPAENQLETDPTLGKIQV